MTSILPDEFPYDYADYFYCVAVGTYYDEPETVATCLGACQRPENPCIVDIDYALSGVGAYEMISDLTVFSLDTTDGFDGTWHLLRPLDTDSAHSGGILHLTGSSQVFRFVADMCDHVSSFFSETRICYRITFRQYVPITSGFGPFDDSGNPIVSTPEQENPNPTITPRGGCRRADLMGPR